jgi:hypothetical protein
LVDKRSPDDIHFAWTQLRKIEYTEYLKPKFAPPKEKLYYYYDEEPEEKTNDEPPPIQINGGLRVYNKVEDNFHLSNKKALFYNLTAYYRSLGQDPFITIPVTFHLKNGASGSDFEKFRMIFEKS